MDNNMLGYFATHQMELDKIVDGLAAVGFPDCNTDQAQDAVAEKLGYRDAEDMYKLLNDDDIKYINKELRRRLL